MKKKFLRNILFLVFINVLVKPFYLFGIDRGIQNTLPPGDYGIFATLFGFTFLFQILNDFGLQGFNNRQVAQHRHMLGKYFGDFLTLKGFLGLLYSFFVFLIGWWTGYLMAYPVLLGGIVLNQCLASLLLFLRSNISGLGRYRADSILSVTDRLVLIVLLGVMLFIPSGRKFINLYIFVGAQTIALVIACIIAYILLRPFVRPVRIRLNPALLVVILRKSYPYALVVFLMTLYTRIDSVMIEQMLPEGWLEVDRYASAYRLLDASNMIGFLFASLLLPMFSRQISKGENPGELASFSAGILLSGAITLAVTVYFFRTPIMNALYVDGNAYSGDILGWLMFSFIGMCGTYIYGTLLTANGRLMPMNGVFLVSVFINVGLNMWLIPKNGALGAAQATCVTQLFVFVAQLFLAIEMLSLQFKGGLILRLSIVAFLVVISGLSLNAYTELQWLIKGGIVLLSGVLGAMTTGIIDLRGIKDMLIRNRMDA
ncbi:MAG: oligosaccharide flippase family protein [Saprospiraceae bacterium]|nr:oligosaccharide flippase family protein [Saprospiraceae bacterium]